MSKFNVLLLASWAAKLAAAKDVYLDWNVTWVNAAPDGFERPVIGINGQWPCPQIDVDLGDRLIVDVYNDLGNQSTGIHWHGFHQYHSAVMDGSSSVTQCPLPPGEHMQYHFDVNQTGTYWYHSHNMGQYPDGFRGPLIVHDPNPPFHYDEEFTLTLSDWNHGQMADLIAQYESRQNEAAFGGREPLPDAALINDSTNTKIKVEPGKTYLVHVVCLGNWPGHTWVLDGHEMTVVEVDGVYTEPRPAGDQMLRIATGQRISALIHTKNDTSQNFAIWDTMDVNMMFVYEDRPIPKGYNPNVTAWLVYDEAKPLPPPPVFHELNFLDDVSLAPADKEPLLQPVDHQIILDTFSTEINGIKRFTVNNKTYIPQDVPTLYTANTVGHELASNPEVYGQVNPFVVKYGEVVEIVINNHHNNLHPWHMHGHQFQVLQRSAVDGGYFTGQYYQNVSQTPMRRDTIMVQNHGHVVLRFRADNPGVWLLHCHVEWHVEAGLMATIIEAPETFPGSQNAPPKSHYDACAAYPDPTHGNAAGKHGLDLAGANTKVPVENHGATYVHKNDTAVPLDSSPSPWSSQSPAPKPSTKQSSTPAPTHTPTPSPHKSPVPKPSHPHSPPPAPVPSHHQAPPPPQPPAQQAPGPRPYGHQPAPEPPVEAPQPVAVEPAPEPVTQPVYSEPAPTYYYLVPVPAGHDKPIFVNSDDIKGPWPQPHADHGHAQIGDGSDGPPDVADSQDIKGPWPNPHADKSHAQVGGGPGEAPIEVGNSDVKGPWPYPHQDSAYVKQGGHLIHTHDNGDYDLPKGYQYWGAYERHPSEHHESH